MLYADYIAAEIDYRWQNATASYARAGGGRRRAARQRQQRGRRPSGVAASHP